LGILFGSLYAVLGVVLSAVEIIYLLLLFSCKSKTARGLGVIPYIGGGMGSGAESLSWLLVILLCWGVYVKGLLSLKKTVGVNCFAKLVMPFLKMASLDLKTMLVVLFNNL